MQGRAMQYSRFLSQTDCEALLIPVTCCSVLHILGKCMIFSSSMETSKATMHGNASQLCELLVLMQAHHFRFRIDANANTEQLCLMHLEHIAVCCKQL